MLTFLKKLDLCTALKNVSKHMKKACTKTDWVILLHQNRKKIKTKTNQWRKMWPRMNTGLVVADIQLEQKLSAYKLEM